MIIFIKKSIHKNWHRVNHMNNKINKYISTKVFNKEFFSTQLKELSLRYVLLYLHLPVRLNFKSFYLFTYLLWRQMLHFLITADVN